jgi:hypothetical protein
LWAKPTRVSNFVPYAEIVEGQVLAIILDDLFDNPGAVEDRDRNSVLMRQLVFELGPRLIRGELAGDTDDPTIAPVPLDEAGNVGADLFDPLLLRAERESPALLGGILGSDIPERRYLLGDGDRLGIRFAVPAPMRACRGPEIGAEGAFAELAAEQLEVRRLVAIGDGGEVVFQDLALQNDGRPVFGVRKVYSGRRPRVYADGEIGLSDVSSTNDSSARISPEGLPEGRGPAASFAPADERGFRRHHSDVGQ